MKLMILVGHSRSNAAHFLIKSLERIAAAPDDIAVTRKDAETLAIEVDAIHGAAQNEIVERMLNRAFDDFTKLEAAEAKAKAEAHAATQAEEKANAEAGTEAAAEVAKVDAGAGEKAPDAVKAADVTAKS